ncbi:acid protease [Mycena floridula]|nr:acid protease [Mycena floridula]
MWTLFHYTGILAFHLGAVYGSPKILVVRDDASGAGITPLTMASDGSYFATIQTGDINFRLALDTASSDIWLISSRCSTSTCKAVPRYPLEYESSTFQAVSKNDTAFSVSYLDGTAASGFIARESIVVANLTAPSQALGLITNSNVPFADKTSGILGLGFPRLSGMPDSLNDSQPFFTGLAEQGVLEYPLFGLSLTRDSTGSLSFGAIDGSIVKNVSNIGWNEVVEFAPFKNESKVASYLQWAIPMTAFSVDDTQLTTSPTYPDLGGKTSLALFDIGTSGIYGPYQDVERLFALIEGARLVDDGQWALPCTTVAAISFTFGARNYTLQPTDYILGRALGNPNLCLSWIRALPPSPDGIDWQMGSPFLRTVYSIFSYGINAKEPPMIGLYPLRNATSSTETSDFVSSFLSSISATVATTLPNFLLATPTYTTPAYALNSSVTAPTGGIVKEDLATSTYSAMFGKQTDLSKLHTISALPTVAVVVVTDAAGDLSTSFSAVPTVVLGLPPGWLVSSASRRIELSASAMGRYLLLAHLIRIIVRNLWF